VEMTQVVRHTSPHEVNFVLHIQRMHKMTITYLILSVSLNCISFKVIRPNQTTLTNQNFLWGKIRRKLNPGNACYHSVQNLLSSRLSSKNVKMITTYRTILCHSAKRRSPKARGSKNLIPHTGLLMLCSVT
jgi:hypothetical protein